MTLKISFILSIIFISLTILPITAKADVRLKFPKGKDTITVSGKVGTGSRKCYFIHGDKGKNLSAKVTSPSGKVVIFETGEREYSENIEISGQQSVCVDNLSRSSRYTLTISIK